jgi:hypothetical protein
MTANYMLRVEIIRQMLATYDREPTDDRIKGYLTVTSRVPLASFAEAVKNAMANCGGFPPGPGEIVAQWRARASRSPEYTPAPESSPRLGEGKPLAAISSAVGGLEGRVRDPSMQAVFARAAKLRDPPIKVPAGQEGYTLSYICAAIELNFPWPLAADHRKQLSGWMDRHGDHGGDADWWWEECKNPTVTR